MNIRVLLVAAILFCGNHIVSVHAQLLSYDFDNENPDPVTTADGVSGGSFQLEHQADGLVASTFYLQGSGNAIGDNDWSVDEGTKWWSFSLEAEAGVSFDLGSLVFSDRATGSGPTDWSVFINNIRVGFGSSSQVPSGQLGDQAIDLAPFGSSLTGLDFAEVRIFGFGAPGGSGTWRIDDVVLAGDVAAIAPVPEPGTWVLQSFGLGLLCLHHRRRGP